MKSLTIRVFFAMFAPLAGYFTDHFSLGTGLAATGSIILARPGKSGVILQEFKVK